MIRDVSPVTPGEILQEEFLRTIRKSHARRCRIFSTRFNR